MAFLQSHHPFPFLAASPKGAGNSLGIPWWLQVVGAAKDTSILDCGTSGALARSALLSGIGWVVCNLSAAQHAALSTDMTYRDRILRRFPPVTPWPR